MRRISSFNMRLGESPFFFVSDHAGNIFPDHLGTLGLEKRDQERHIAYDIGIKEVGRALASRLNATLVEQHFSRLVIDCNRIPDRGDCIPAESDGTKIAGNQNLSKEEIAWRHENIFKPYHQKISELLIERMDQKKPTLLVSLHSFTPQLKTASRKRPWEIGLLFDHDPKSSALFKKHLLKHNVSLCIGENKPYMMDLEKEYTVPTHGGKRSLSSLEIEVRQDLLQEKISSDSVIEALYQSFLSLKKDLWS